MLRDAKLAYFTRAMPGTMAVAAVGYALNALIFITMARFLEPSNFGNLKVAASTMLVASLVVGLGGSRAAGRFLPPHLSGSPLAAAYLRFFALAIVALSTVLAAAIWADGVFGPDPLPNDIHGHHPVSFIVLLVPIWAGLDLLSQSYMAVRRPVAGALPARFVFPAIGLLAIGAAHWSGWHLSDVMFVVVLTVAGAITLAIFSIHLTLTERMRPHEAIAPGTGRHGTAATGPRDWLELSLPMMGAGLLVILVGEVPLFALALLGDPHSAGLYGAAAVLTQSFLVIITCQRQIYGPALAAAISDGPAAVLRLHVHSQRQALLFVLPLAAVLVLGSGPLLSLFGPGFTEERTILWILVAGLSVQTCMAMVTRWLDYGGHARLVLMAEGSAAVLVAAGSVATIPVYGPVGAAAVFAGVIALKSIALAIVAHRGLGLPVFAFAAAT
ncbi:hypothetical protein BAL199_17643 [alpha proteobacterium BAL199]|nr:hypothetical protein BAL199_17643 [alpha proteobacterium BAL199]